MLMETWERPPRPSRQRSLIEPVVYFLGPSGRYCFCGLKAAARHKDNPAYLYCVQHAIRVKEIYRHWEAL